LIHSIFHFFFILYITLRYISVLAAIAQAVIFRFSFVVSYYDGVLDEMITYDDSDGFARVFVFLCGERGVGSREEKRDKR
jgi:hypothetical protein